jgi:(4S)-4-hydroxy-5-phosphonooxypentane-2,3-dione isomerase
MLAIVVEFRIKPAHAQAFHQAIVDNARLSLETEAGCHRFDVCRDPGDATLFFLYELYDDEAAFQAHLASPHFRQMDAATAGWVDHKSVRRLQRVQS